jgi:lipopolysaccharide heptosyltransferase I
MQPRTEGSQPEVSGMAERRAGARPEPMSEGLASKSPRILICRLSAIGDVILAMPVLCALRDFFPSAFLAWMVDEVPGRLLKGHDALDELITVPRRWLKSPRTVWRIRRQLRAQRFDVAIDVQGLTKSALAAWLSGAERRIGFDGHLGRELSKCFNTELVPTAADHVIDCNLSLVRPLGVEGPTVRFGVPETERDAQAAEEMLHQVGIEGTFVLINTGAGWASRRWPETRYAGVARHLGRAHGCPVLAVWAGDEERASAEQIVAASDGRACLAPSTTLTELAALTRRARLYVGSDTGPMHLAVAVGTPCVSLHGPTLAKCSGPYGEGHITLQKAALDGRFDPRRKTISNELMKAITVEMVCKACDRMLSDPRRDGDGLPRGDHSARHITRQ